MIYKNKHIRVNYIQCVNILAHYIKTGNFSFKTNENSAVYSDNTNDTIFTLKLPVCFPEPDTNTQLVNYCESIPSTPSDYVVVLIQAGHAALGLFRECEIVDNNVIRKYMVRKSQGKSQVKHLKTKGKSREGSRIRLKQTEKFFKEISETLNSWQRHFAAIDNVFIHCPANLKSFLYNGKNEIPFDKNDEIVRKIPFDVKTPDLKELVHINYEISRGTLDIVSVDKARDIGLYDIIESRGE